MATIEREQLRERLLDEGYIADFGIERTIDNLLNLKKLDNPAAYQMLEKWMETGQVEKFDPIEGISLSFLRHTLKMKDPAIILAYGMLLYDPKPSAIFLKQQENKMKKYTPSR